MLLVLRLLLYVQVALGVARLAGLIANPRIWDLHAGLGIVIVVLAIVVLRPLSEMTNDAARVAARFVALTPLVVGLLMTFGILERGTESRVIHVLLASLTITLVEIASARERRGRRSARMLR